MRAARGGHLKCISTLVAHGADVNMTNDVSERLYACQLCTGYLCALYAEA